jgi:hypothetical protein
MGNCCLIDELSYKEYKEVGDNHEIIPADVIFYCIECKEYFQGHDNQYEHPDGWTCSDKCERGWMIQNMPPIRQPFIMNDDNL